jgi:hypothetical protein
MKVFLQGNENNPWVMVITGMECIGKSALLEKMQEQQPEDTLCVPLDLAVGTLQTDIFHFNILEKLAVAISRYSDAQRFATFEAQLDRVREDMAEINRRSAQPNRQSIYADHATVTHVTISSDVRKYLDDGQSNNIDILKTALRRQLRTFTQKKLVILLDNLEWLIAKKVPPLQGNLSADHWLINTLLPELHDYLYPNQLFVIITTRIRPTFEAIKRDDLYDIPLQMLSREEVQNYPQEANFSLTWLPTMYEVTMGHGLSMTLFHEALQELGNPILNTQDKVIQQALQVRLREIFYEKAWDTFVNEGMLKRLALPFGHFIRYGVVPDTFNLPLLRYLFPESTLWYDSGVQNTELQDSQIREVFEMLLRYPCVLQVTSNSQQDYSIHPLVRTILLKHLEEHDQERLAYYRQQVNEYKQKAR